MTYDIKSLQVDQAEIARLESEACKSGKLDDVLRAHETFNAMRRQCYSRFSETILGAESSQDKLIQFSKRFPESPIKADGLRALTGIDDAPRALRKTKGNVRINHSRGVYRLSFLVDCKFRKFKLTKKKCGQCAHCLERGPTEMHHILGEHWGKALDIALRIDATECPILLAKIKAEIEQYIADPMALQLLEELDYSGKVLSSDMNALELCKTCHKVWHDGRSLPCPYELVQACMST